MDRLRQSHVFEMQDLKYTWSTALQKNGARTRASSSSSVGMIPHEPSHEDHRVAELEKTIKQKDHAIQALKAMLERQQSISDDKVNLANTKYDHVKAINVVLQVGRKQGSECRSW
ncbi:hypothetical protein DYB34_013003 [Aphanomyces astaci]|uniref:Uncharacterized protein n=1 Tax=Aphanomyces astaci TaxID=112090 RepID=A0A3R6XCH6_APHAT|nr:hypothetical protein DYB34_013003 [Aphanomyces astaci]